MKVFIFSKVTFKSLCLLLFIDFFKVVFWPDWNLVLWGVITIFADLMTGVAKAHITGTLVVSTGIRKTIVKFVQYIGVVFLLFVLTNAVVANPKEAEKTWAFFGENMYSKIQLTLQYLNSLVLFLIVYTECLSITENLMEIDNKSVFSKWVIRPLHKILTISIINNPFRKWVDKQGEPEKKETILKP